MIKTVRSLLILSLLFFLTGCAARLIPVREGLREDLSLTPGKIEKNQFTGMRYPFKVSAPPHWTMTTEFPGFLEDLGYIKPGPNDKEQTELYIFNPSTQSNVQIDLTPADRYSVFSQELIERLTSMATGSLESELEEEYGKNYGKDLRLELGPLSPFSLKGVPFAAKKYASYTVKGVKREQGWIYGFAEPYQIFILYILFEKEGTKDRQDMKAILDSFEMVSKK